MQVQVSYIKQFIFFVILAVIFLIGIEVLVNFWWYFLYTCEFEKNELFDYLDKETKRQMCLESIDLQFTTKEVNRVKGIRQINNTEIFYINSEGFRGPEFSKEKPPNTYRIFAVGGSTTFGHGVFENQTFPFYLQKKFNEENLSINVEVINAGIGGAASDRETKMIKEKIIAYEPDLIMVFDGFNDLDMELKNDPNASHILWKERWLEICDLGKEYDFETIITLQPITGSGKKILTDQEYIAYQNVMRLKILEPYPLYVERLGELTEHCTITNDLRNLFDDVQEPIFFDKVHTGPQGNLIIANEFFVLAQPPSSRKNGRNIIF